MLKWDRRWPMSKVNYDLILASPTEANADALGTLLEDVENASHRGITLNSSATSEFKRWFKDPGSPLKAHAYVLLSNWFLTAGGDSSSDLARSCEVLWDALFAARPAKRLSSSVRGRNHIPLPDAFDQFWARLITAQEDVPHLDGSTSLPRIGEGKEGSNAPLKATILIGKLRCEAEGSPKSVAELIQLLSSSRDSLHLENE